MSETVDDGTEAREIFEPGSVMTALPMRTEQNRTVLPTIVSAACNIGPNSVACSPWLLDGTTAAARNSPWKAATIRQRRLDR